LGGARHIAGNIEALYEKKAQALKDEEEGTAEGDIQSEKL
jgi:hypothetical protein